MYQPLVSLSCIIPRGNAVHGKALHITAEHGIYLWKRLRSWRPACNQQWRTEATRSASPPSRPTRLPSSRTRCRLWCSHLHKKKTRTHTQTHQGVTICLTIAGDQDMQCCWSSNWAVIWEEKKGIKKKPVWSCFQEPDVALKSKSVNRFTGVHKNVKRIQK